MSPHTRHRHHKTRHDSSESPARYPAKTALGNRRNRQNHRNTASRHRGGSPRTMAEEAVRIIAYLFPYDLIELGDKGKTIKKAEVTREEYLLSLKLMEVQ